MTIQQALRSADQRLQKNNVTSSLLDSEVLLSHLLKKSKAYLLTHGEIMLTPKQLTTFNTLIQRRSQHEPVAYIIGKKEFFGLTFTVNKDVLIPRPESELIVEEVLKIASSKKVSTIADIGTGSGAILISLAVNMRTPATYIGTDISKLALQVAEKNRKTLAPDAKISFHHGDLLEPLGKKKLDVLIANLPYLSDEVYENSHTHAELTFEPFSALVAEDDGLALIKKLLLQAPKNLKKGGTILLEISPEQALPLRDFVLQAYPQAHIDFITDLCNMPRLAKISLN